MKRTRLGSSPDLESAATMIAEFYCTTRDRIALEPKYPAARKISLPAQFWTVYVGDRAMTSVEVAKQGKRYVFQSTIV